MKPENPGSRSKGVPHEDLVRRTEAPESTGPPEMPPPEIVIYPRLHCPACQSTETRIASTRKPIRYHVCLACGQRFKSVEPD